MKVFSMQHSMLLLLCYLLLCCCITLTTQMESNTLQQLNRTVVFVAGWPQSGTSMIHRFLSSHPLISSMVEQCRLKHGNRCENWNYEGQWLLSDAQLRQRLYSGTTCPINSLPQSIQTAIFNEWKPLWHPSLPVVVEKSPQSLVKIKALQEIFSKQGFRVKILIVIKHPVTINTMTPRQFSWKYEREIVGSNLKQLLNNNNEKNNDKEISIQQMAENVRYFVHTLSHQYLANTDGKIFEKNCSLGWIPAYESLLNVIEDPKNGFTRNNIRIVHYESFALPMTQCLQILQFIFPSEAVLQNHRNLCSKLFAQTSSTSDTAVLPSRKRNQQKHRALFGQHTVHNENADNEQRETIKISHMTKSIHGDIHDIVDDSDENYNENTNSSNIQRQLRLRTSPYNNNNNAGDGFHFQTLLVQQEGQKRIREFVQVRKLLATHAADTNHDNNDKVGIKELLNQLEALQGRILALGYHLHILMPIKPNNNVDINNHMNNGSNNKYKLAKWLL